jgi:tetratricopeptide (TPR) repeat protein
VSDHPAPVATTWSLSFQRVEERNPAAADLLRVCAFLSPDAIAEEILTAGASHLGPILSSVAANTFLLSHAMEALRAYSLIKRDPERKTISLHRLVQAVLQDTLEEAERHSWAERAVLAVNAVFPHVELGTWPQCERLLTHALTVIQVIEQYQMITEEAGRLLYETASYLQDHGRYQEAEALYLRALRIREQALGSQHPETAETIRDLAQFWEMQGNNEEARAWYSRALAIREQVLGAHHPQTTETRTRLIALLHTMGQHEEAAKLEATQAES